MAVIKKVLGSIKLGPGLRLVRGRISITPQGSSGEGEANTGANVGTGTGLFKNKSGVTLQFYKVKGQNGVAVSQVSDDVVFDGSHSHTKADIEAVLTGEISSHTHPGGGGGLTQPQVLARGLGA